MKCPSGRGHYSLGATHRGSCLLPWVQAHLRDRQKLHGQLRQKLRLRAMDEFLEFTEAHCGEKQAAK